jgi:hypothetical protein
MLAGRGSSQPPPLIRFVTVKLAPQHEHAIGDSDQRVVVLCRAGRESVQWLCGASSNRARARSAGTPELAGTQAYGAGGGERSGEERWPGPLDTRGELT